MRRIGYLIPEFPGQTHIFFWRERQELQKLGIEPELVSTRRPPTGLVSHDWSDVAIRQTKYLFPPTASDMVSAAVVIAKAMPSGWARCIASIASAEKHSNSTLWGLRGRLLVLAVMGARLAGLAKSRGWTHLHCHSCADAANVALFAHLFSGIPYSMTLHGPLSYFGPNQREKWRHASLVLTVTKLLRSEVERELAGALPLSMHVAPMGVDTNRFRRQKPFEPWQGQGTLHLFSCGRLNVGKGHQDLIKAVGLLRQTGIDARLVIAGEDDAGGTGFRAKLESEIERQGLKSSVLLLGAVNEGRIVQELEEAHVFCLASHEEAIGVATMEAMAMSVPVVVTCVGGVAELVQDGKNGLFVPAQQHGALAVAIQKVAEDPTLARQLGQCGRQTVEMQFRSNRSAEILAKHIEERGDVSYER
jgi:colanic acid/amylovoran biosynthesis glycosyltransferase